MGMKILLTLDYELFLGAKSGSVEGCLIRPMDKIRQVLDKYGVKAALFVDAAYLLRLNELKATCPSLQSDLNQATVHIKSLASMGHEIQFHFHPQWLYSQYDEQQRKWDIDQMHYKLSDMDADFACQSFRAAKALLDDIVGRQTFAYRAGGYSLNSFPGYSRLLQEAGIRIDSSVCNRRKCDGAFQAYDYRQVPRLSAYHFSDDVQQEDKKGKLLEVPIAFSSPMCSLRYLYKKRQYARQRLSCKQMGDGISFDGSMSLGNKIRYQLNKLFGSMSYSASIDFGSVDSLLHIYKEHCRENKRYFVLIGHPKATSPASLDALERFISIVSPQAEFCTFQNLYDTEFGGSNL